MNENQECAIRGRYRVAAIERYGENRIAAVYDLIRAVTDSADATRVSGEFYGQNRHGQMAVTSLGGNPSLLDGTVKVGVGGHRGVAAVMKARRLIGFTYATSNYNSEHVLFVAVTSETRRLWGLAAPVLKEYRVSYRPDGALIPHESGAH